MRPISVTTRSRLNPDNHHLAAAPCSAAFPSIVGRNRFIAPLGETEGIAPIGEADGAIKRLRPTTPDFFLTLRNSDQMAKRKGPAGAEPSRGRNSRETISKYLIRRPQWLQKCHIRTDCIAGEFVAAVSVSLRCPAWWLHVGSRGAARSRMLTP